MEGPSAAKDIRISRRGWNFSAAVADDMATPRVCRPLRIAEPVISSQQQASPHIVYRRPRTGPMVQFRRLTGYEWNRVELTLPQLPAELHGTRIVHLSDLHLRKRWPAELGELIERINADPPADLVLFTGDFVDSKKDHRPALPLVERLVKSLRPRSGVWAIVGNHDGDLLPPRLIAMGVRVLMNERAEVIVRGQPVELIGLAGADRIDFDERFVHTVPPKRPGVPRIVLCHYPDLIRAARPMAPDLYLAGHTHGGQICLPNQRALLSHDSLPKRLCKGAHDVEGTCLVVSRGFGFTTIPLRIFCPAEVVEIELKVMRNAE
jgi:predicted MPP superfamily phosphohydrolase